MNSMDIVLTLVFSLVMLLFMSVPAMRVTHYLQENWGLPSRWHTPTVLILTAFFSLLIGLFLRFA